MKGSIDRYQEKLIPSDSPGFFSSTTYKNEQYLKNLTETNSSRKKMKRGKKLHGYIYPSVIRVKQWEGSGKQERTAHTILITL